MPTATMTQRLRAGYDQARTFVGDDVPPGYNLRVESIATKALDELERIEPELLAAQAKLAEIAERVAAGRHGATRWADPLPVPDWVLSLEAILGTGPAAAGAASTDPKGD